MFLNELLASQLTITYCYAIVPFFFVLMLGFWISGYLRRKRMLRVMRKGRRLEEKGAILLKASGYRILKEQPSRTSKIIVDDEVFDKVVRADFLVKRGFKRYIVEVKGGNLVCDPTSSITRRQLLEYYSCFQMPNMLFVDAIKGEIYKITFPNMRRKGGFLPGFISGVILLYLLLKWAACLKTFDLLLTFIT